MKKRFQFTALILFVLLTQINYAQPVVYADHEIYNPGDSISFVFKNGPGNALDWIGIYKVGDIPDTVDATDWDYVGNGITDGRLVFPDIPDGLKVEGDYWVGFFENDGYNLLAADSFKIKAGQPFININSYEYDIAEPIKVDFKNGPGNPTDWIGIYKLGDTPGPVPSTLWFYVNGTQGATDGITDGSVTFQEGLVDKGSWWVGFFENDGYTILDSIGFVVTNVSDSIPPAAPEISVTPSNYYNLVTWSDVEGEINEMYSVYVSIHPITDVSASGVDLVGIDIAQGTQVFEHILKSANTDRERTYYYAVTCKDLSGNVSPPGTYGPVTNTARGVTTISINPPAPFVADGDLSEWAGITPFIMSADSGTANVPQNNVVNGDNDLSAEVKIALDENYLYVSMEVIDDAYHHPQSLSPWERDEPDLYIGLYNLTNMHVDYGRGATADYQLRFDEDRIRLDADTDDSLFIPVGENYFHDGGTLSFSGYLFEARIPLSDLETKRQAGQTANDVINWKAGDRVPFTIGINDNDDGLTREGMIFYSPQPQEAAYWNVSTWTYTWIADEPTGVDDNSSLVKVYDLKQNYPNPFNPNTQIQYSIAEPGLVSIKVYDIIGKQVAELVNNYQNAGTYKVNFSTDKLNLTSGVYFYKLQSNNFVSVRKMLLLK